MKATANVLIFGGTTEGRLLCEAFSREGRAAVVCTATGYGAALVDALPGIRIHSRRMDSGGIASLIRDGIGGEPGTSGFDTVVDATHPYAVDVSRNIREACNKTGCRYLRVIRDETGPLPSSGIRTVPDIDAAVEYLSGTGGNIFLATGSKELRRFCRLPAYQDRLYARVLPDADVIRSCNELGIKGDHLIAMQGPFSRELNLALLRQFHCAFLVTKNSGRLGGLDDKLEAAGQAGAEVVLVSRRGRETGHSLDEVFELLGLTKPAERKGT